MNLKWIHILIVKCCVSTEEQSIRVEYKDKRWHGKGFFVGFRVRGTAYFCIPCCEILITTSSTNFTYVQDEILVLTFSDARRLFFPFSLSRNVNQIDPNTLITFQFKLYPFKYFGLKLALNIKIETRF